MNISAISSTTQKNPVFGQIVLGRGGAKRLAQSMPQRDAETLINNHLFNPNDILITENSVEVMPEAKNRIYNISRIIASGKDFTDIEVFEHGMKNIFRINREVNADKYGTKNKQISLAEAIAEEINNNRMWKNNLRTDDSKEAMPDSIQRKADAITRYSQCHGTF